MAVGDAYVFPGFLTPVLTQLFLPKPPTTFLTCFCRGERRKYARKKSRLDWGSNSQPQGHESDTLTTEPPRRGICMYSCYIECFPTPEKSSSVIAHLIIEEIIPRYGCCLEVLHDNGLENIAKQVQDLLSYMKINRYYSPRSNGLCEKSHSTLLSVKGKLMNENSSWELLIPQALASVSVTNQA